jgi:glutaminyl-tRNA synthetase
MADLNPASMEVLSNCLLEPELASASEGEAVQFERLGYFCRDRDSTPTRPVFIRTVGLRDTAKAQIGGDAQPGANADVLKRSARKG